MPVLIIHVTSGPMYLLQLGATVLLHHPCAAFHERQLLSYLARSCLPHYIITPYPWLNSHMVSTPFDPFISPTEVTAASTELFHSGLLIWFTC